MIICFTGTGNTRVVSDMINAELGDRIVRLAPGQMRNPSKVTINVADGRVIWATPVFCWGIPVLAAEIMSKINIESDVQVIHHLVCTCGDDIGYADKQWRAIMKSRGWETGNAFSVQMPNTFTFMKGFDIDAPEVAERKIAAMPDRVCTIVDAITDGRTDITDVVRGSFPWFKSHVIRPWFNHYKVTTRNFHADDNCMGCGKCARNCPVNCIRIVDGKPVWEEGHCTLCSRCYHCCPRHAVHYGSQTANKGQYIADGYNLQP